MKLTILREDLDRGEHRTRLSQQQLDNLKDAQTIRCGIVSIKQLSGEPRYNAVLVESVDLESKEWWNIGIVPLAVRCFCVWDARKANLNQLTIDTGGEQWSFDVNGNGRRTNMTLAGPGVDPQVAQASYDELEKLLKEHTSQAAVYAALAWLKSRYATKKKAA